MIETDCKNAPGPCSQDAVPHLLASARFPHTLEHSFRQYALLLNPSCAKPAKILALRRDGRALGEYYQRERMRLHTLKSNSDFLAIDAFTPGPPGPLRSAGKLHPLS